MEKVAKKNLGSRAVLSGEKLELYDYRIPIFIDYERDHDVKKEKKEDYTKREDNVYRARRAVRQIVWCNIEPHSKFLTLTYDETMLDVKIFQRHFQTFLQAMRRKHYDLKYLYVLERQKKRGKREGNLGTIHAHLVVFNDEFIPYEIIRSCWKHGSIDIHMLDGLREDNGEKVKDAGAYICKYISKDTADEWGTRCYRCSVGLKRPKELKFYVYGEINEKGVPVYAGNDLYLYEALEKVCNITYQSKKDYQFSQSDGTVFKNTVYYKQGTLPFKVEINE